MLTRGGKSRRDVINRVNPESPQREPPPLSPWLLHLRGGFLCEKQTQGFPLWSKNMGGGPGCVSVTQCTPPSPSRTARSQSSTSPRGFPVRYVLSSWLQGALGTHEHQVMDEQGINLHPTLTLNFTIVCVLWTSQREGAS